MKAVGGISLRNAEKFIRQWQKNRQKGKLKYILINSAVYCIVYWIAASLYLIGAGKNISKLMDNLDIFLIMFFIYLVCLFVAWDKNEDKYNSLINGKK